MTGASDQHVAQGRRARAAGKEDDTDRDPEPGRGLLEVESGEWKPEGRGHQNRSIGSNQRLPGQARARSKILERCIFEARKASNVF